MMARQRRQAPSSHRAGPFGNSRRRRLRAAAAVVFSLVLGVLTLTGATTASAQSSGQAGSALLASSAAPAVGSLTTEHTTNPLGIGTGTPELGWVIASAGRGVSQSKYEISVATSMGSLMSGQGLVWDSGVVNSAQSFDVSYAGPALASQTRYLWRVRVWDNNGTASAWSTPAWFETAFLDPSQFQGSWIEDATKPGGAEVLLRKDFTLGSQSITRARLYVAGLSYPYLSVNGHPVSDHVLDTAFTTNDKTVDYNTFDVTQLVQSGANALAVSLGNGFYSAGADDYPATGTEPTMKAELQVWYADGTSARVVTDTSWKATTGPTTANSPAAETYDARLEKPGWTQTSYDDSGWNGTVVMPSASTLPSYSGTPAADWIWNVPNAGVATPEGTIYLRKTFTVTDPSTISSAELRVNADDGQMTWVNGTLVSSSPGNVINGWQTSQVSDIKSLLVPGTNVIAIAGIATDTNANSVIAAAQIDSTRIVTDGTWKALPGTPATPPAGWNTASFDDSSWAAANVTAAYGTGPWGNGVANPAAPVGVLRAQLIPPIEETATISPTKVTPLPGSNLPTPSYSGSPTADWIWNTPGATVSTAPGTIYLRKTFTVTDPSTISSAVLRVNADDGEMTYVNGTLVANQPVAVNAWQTSKIVDIKSLLVPGTNVIAIAGIPDDGANSVIAAAQIDSTRIVTDATWKALPGTPATPPAGWNTASFDDSSWPAADVSAAYGTGPWGSNVITPPGPTTVCDFGITTSGWAKITMQGTAGTAVQISYSEKLNSDGTVQSEGNGSTGQTDTYILKGGGAPETYEPKYGWKGYRWVQVSTAPGVPLPRIMSATGVVVHTNLATSGNFTSSSSLLNEMHTAMVNTILNNQYSYGSDTPTYEKGGWTNDNGDYSDSEMANFDAEAYYTHMMQNFDDSQDTAGNIGWLVPTQPGGDNVDPLWGGSFLLIEYNMYQNYDGLSVLRRDYANMAGYVNDLDGQIASSGYIYQGTTFGDWSVPSNANPPSSEMLGSMFLYRETEDLSLMAQAIGNTADASKYAALAGDIRMAVNNEFYDAAGHVYRDPVGLNSHALGGPNGTITSTAYDQTANVYGLAFGLAPQGDQQAIADGLAANVTAQGNHLAVGANGAKYILPMLTDYGYGNLAYLVATNPTAPGWGQWFQQCGATTMWEAWEDTSCNSARSRDHAFMGTIDDWFYSNVAGIQSTSAGFRTLSIDPSPVQGLTAASGYETTPLGRVSSSWTKNGTSFTLTAQVPVGATASICVPAASAATVTESGSPISSASGVTVTGMQGSCLQVKVGSGTYDFQSTVS